MKLHGIRHPARKVLAGLVLGLVYVSPLSASHGRGISMPALAARLDTLVLRAIANGATPGAALAIGHADDEPVIRTYGRIDWRPSAPAVTASTLYDLASVTKVVATTPAAMLLVQQGRLDMDAPVARYLSWWPQEGAKSRITIRQLLLHTSGLPAGNELWRVDGDREARIRHIAEVPLVASPGQATEYSDLGMIVLGAVVESVAGERLDAFVRDRLFTPLAMPDTRYLPLSPDDGTPVDPDRIAPTQWAGRRGHLQGDVDDANAWALDGVAGHAGLFSSITDVARFARMVLGATEGLGTQVLDPALVRAFAAHRPDGGRALGWDGAGSSSWGRYFSSSSFGHNGYTGTSIWIDPERDIYVVLLTNRVNPSDRNQKHLALRREIGAAVGEGSPLRLASVEAQPTEAAMFAAEVAAARTIFRAPVESIRRALARHSERAHAARRHPRTRVAAAKAKSHSRAKAHRAPASSSHRARHTHKSGRHRT